MEKIPNVGSIGMSNFNMNGAGLNYGNNHGNSHQNRIQNYEFYNKRSGLNFKGPQDRTNFNNHIHNQSNYMVTQNKTFPNQTKYDFGEPSIIPTYQKISFNTLANVYEERSDAENKKMKISEKIKISSDLVNQLKNKTTSQILDNIHEGGINSFRTLSTIETEESLRNSISNKSTNNNQSFNFSNATNLSNKNVSLSAHTSKLSMTTIAPQFSYPSSMVPFLTPKHSQTVNLGNFNSNKSFQNIPQKNLNKHFTNLKKNNQLQMSALYKAPQTQLKQNKFKKPNSENSALMEKLKGLMEERDSLEKESEKNENPILKNDSKLNINNINDTFENPDLEPKFLEVKIKTSDGDYKVFEYHRGEDLLKRANLFCEENKISEKLVKPICYAVNHAFDSVRSVLVSKIVDVENLNLAFKEYNDYLGVSEEESTICNLSTLSCPTVCDKEPDSEKNRLNKSL